MSFGIIARRTLCDVATGDVARILARNLNAANPEIVCLLGLHDRFLRGRTLGGHAWGLARLQILARRSVSVGRAHSEEQRPYYEQHPHNKHRG